MVAQDIGFPSANQLSDPLVTTVFGRIRDEFSKPDALRLGEADLEGDFPLIFSKEKKKRIEHAYLY